MTILLIVGIALVVFGAVVLLLFPDRPGGRIVLHGVEVSSVGAGLPLIVVGVVAVAVAGARGDGISLGGNGGDGAPGGAETAATSGCFGTVFGGIPRERTEVVEAGAQGVDVIGPSESKSGDVGLRFTDGGRPVGGVRLAFFPSSQVFRLQRVVDADCREVEDVHNVTRPGSDPHTAQNFDDVRIRFADNRFYDLRLGAGATIRIGFRRVTP